jgi:hypothetical protein
MEFAMLFRKDNRVTRTYAGYKPKSIRNRENTTHRQTQEPIEFPISPRLSPAVQAGVIHALDDIAHDRTYIDK